MLFVLVPSGILAAEAVNVGTGMWARFSHGPSTFELAPGASLTADLEVLPDLRLGAKVLSGALLGYATGVEVSLEYSPSIGPWMPGVGIAAQGMFVSTVFYYHGVEDLLHRGGRQSPERPAADRFPAQ